MKLVRTDNAQTAEPFPGVKRETLAWGEELMLTRNTFDAGASLAAHAHPHAQVTFVLEGELDLTIGDEKVHLSPGDSVSVPPNVPHAASVTVRTVVLDAFAPARKDFVGFDPQRQS